MENVEECVNEFLNEFLSMYHIEYSVIFDNLDTFLDLMYYVKDKLNDFVLKYNEVDDFSEMTKMNIFEKFNLIDEFYFKYGLEFDVSQIVNNGIFNPFFVFEKDSFEGDAHYVEGRSIVRDEYKSVNVYDNQLLTDAIIWFHETVHYRNQIKNQPNQIVDLYSEATAFAEEFVFIDYLDKLGYSKDANFMKLFELKNFRNIVIAGIYVTKIYLTYTTFGSVSVENYKLLFTDDYYEDTLNIFVKEINDNPTIIFTLIWYTLACVLSIYMYSNYKLDENYFYIIDNLNTNMVKENINEFLKIIGLTGYDKISKEKINDAFDLIKKEVGDYYKNKRVQWVKSNLR